MSQLRLAGSATGRRGTRRRRRRDRALAPGDRDPVVGLRRLRNPVRRVPPAGPPARRVREDRRRRRGAPPDRHRAGRRPALPVGRRRRPRPAFASHLRSRGLRAGAVNPNLFQDPDYRLGSITNPDAGIRRKAIDHLLECVDDRRPRWGPTAQSLWLADGTNYAGQDDLRARRRRLRRWPRRAVRGAPGRARSCSSSTSSSSPRSTPPTSPTGARRVLLCQALGERARVLVDLGHHAQGVNVEQIVAILADEGRLGGFHFNNRKYADDDLIVGSVNPFELFSIFVELGRRRRAAAAAHHRPVPQRRAQDGGDGAEHRQPAGELRQVAAGRPRRAARSPRTQGDVLRGHELLLDAYNTDVRPLCAKVRVRARRAPPIRSASCGASGYAQRCAERRAAGPASVGGRRMSVAASIVAAGRRRAGTRTPRRGRRPPSDEVLLASHLLGSNRALANFGGGNTSAKGTATDHVGREVAAMWVKGSGSDLATMSAADFTPLRLDEVLPLLRARRDERRGHGRLPRPLPAGPGRPPVLDRDAAARLHPGGARPPHPSRRASTRWRARATGAI